MYSKGSGQHGKYQSVTEASLISELSSIAVQNRSSSSPLSSSEPPPNAMSLMKSYLFLEMRYTQQNRRRKAYEKKLNHSSRATGRPSFASFVTCRSLSRSCTARRTMMGSYSLRAVGENPRSHARRRRRCSSVSCSATIVRVSAFNNLPKKSERYDVLHVRKRFGNHGRYGQIIIVVLGSELKRRVSDA